MASPSWQRRNAQARALGYRNYYDYRAHGNGTLPPSAPRLAGERLRQARGHASAADLERAAGPGALVTTIGEGRRPDGTYRVLRVTVIDLDGRQREFVLRGRQAQGRQLRQTIRQVASSGAVFSPTPSLDIQEMTDDLEPPEFPDWLDFEEEETDE